MKVQVPPEGAAEFTLETSGRLVPTRQHVWLGSAWRQARKGHTVRFIQMTLEKVKLPGEKTDQRVPPSIPVTLK